MKFLLRQTAIFIIPFCLWLGLLIVVDPFNFFNLSHLVSDHVKTNTSRKLNSRLWKAIEFRRNPSANILLGDSRAEGIDVQRIKSATGCSYFNFAHGGGSIAEIINTFDYAKNISRLSNVYIGISFDLYNEYNSANLFSGAELIANDYKYYLFNRSVAEALFYNLVSFLTKKDPQIGLPPMDKEAFWQYQLDYPPAYMYLRYRYPSNYYYQLKKVASYCKAHNINLVFVILPTHVDLQKRVIDYGLGDAEARFKKDLATLGTVYDFDYPNEWTKKKENFFDPFHSNENINRFIVSDVWGNTRNCVRVSIPQVDSSGFGIK